MGAPKLLARRGNRDDRDYESDSKRQRTRRNEEETWRIGFDDRVAARMPSVESSRLRQLRGVRLRAHGRFDDMNLHTYTLQGEARDCGDAVQTLVEIACNIEKQPRVHIHASKAVGSRMTTQTSLHDLAKRTGAEVTSLEGSSGDRFLTIATDAVRDLWQAAVQVCKEVQKQMRLPADDREPDEKTSARMLQEYMKKEADYEQQSFKLIVLISEEATSWLQENNETLLKKWRDESGATIELHNRKHTQMDMFFATFNGQPRQLWKAQALLYGLMRTLASETKPTLTVEIMIPASLLEKDDLGQRLNSFSGATTTFSSTPIDNGNIALARISGDFEQSMLAQRYLRALVAKNV